MKVSIFFTEISGFVGRRYERGGRNVDGINFAKFRLKSPKKSPKTGCKRKIGEISKNMPAAAILSAKFRFVSPIFREISRYFLPVQPAHRIQNLSKFFFFFLKKHEMFLGNLIMICRQRLCFSAWLKNRGFGVREI